MASYRDRLARLQARAARLREAEAAKVAALTHAGEAVGAAGLYGYARERWPDSRLFSWGGHDPSKYLGPGLIGIAVLGVDGWGDHALAAGIGLTCAVAADKGREIARAAAPEV